MTNTEDAYTNLKRWDGEEHSTVCRHIVRGIAYGDIVRGIVHEVRNPLQSIIFAAQSLAESADARSDTLADVLVRSTERVSRTLELIAYLFDADPGLVGPVALPDVVRRVTDLQAFNRGAALINIECQFTPQLPAVSGRVRDIEDALCVLVNGSIDAVGEGKDGRVTIHVTTADEGIVAVRVCDTGDAHDAHRRSGREDLTQGIAAAESILGTHGATIESSTHGNPRTVLHLPCWSDR